MDDVLRHKSYGQRRWDPLHDPASAHRTRKRRCSAAGLLGTTNPPWFRRTRTARFGSPSGRGWGHAPSGTAMGTGIASCLVPGLCERGVVPSHNPARPIGGRPIDVPDAENLGARVMMRSQTTRLDVGRSVGESARVKRAAGGRGPRR
jgi:hypothetical protein